MHLFLRLTVLIALVLAGLFVLAFALKLMFIAAVLAAFAFAGIFAYGLIRRAGARPSSSSPAPR